MTEISKTLLKQRLRNRIIENLEAFAKQDIVEVLGTVEIINLWDDVVGVARIEFFDEPVFTREEQIGIREFHALYENKYHEVPETWKIKDLSNCCAWKELAENARRQYDIFAFRGMFDEHKEIY